MAADRQHPNFNMEEHKGSIAGGIVLVLGCAALWIFLFVIEKNTIAEWVAFAAFVPAAVVFSGAVIFVLRDAVTNKKMKR